MNSPRLTYLIQMPQPHTHLYQVQITLTALEQATTLFLLPAWTPGSYLIRDYARHVQQFAVHAHDNPHHTLAWRKVAKDCWQVDTAGVRGVVVRYAVYAHELSVRTSHLDGSHGYFNGATVFMYSPDALHEPVRLIVEPPIGWGWQVTCGLDADQDAATAPDPQRVYFRAQDYDELIDCPVECGTHRLLHFEVDHKSHRIAIWGHGNEDAQRILEDTRTIVETQRDLFGSLPYAHYTFILHLATGYGGLEHRNSVTNLVDRFQFQPRRNYERFLELQSHEFFHVWNIKRIRPAPLGPFDYRRENYTTQLWLVEGVTSYYDRLLLVRARLMSAARYLELLGEDLLKLRRVPGQAMQSLAESSFDAWIKYYRPDENSNNSSVSYYLKGALVMLMLDLEIRQRTRGAYSFDDVLRYLNQHYPPSSAGIPEPDGLLHVLETLLGPHEGWWRQFFRRYITGTELLDLSRVLGYVGLQVQWGYALHSDDAPPPAWLGLNVREQYGQTLVTSVQADSPAHLAGVYAGDELVALNGFRVNEQRLRERLYEQRPNDQVTLSVFRRDELVQIPVVLAPAPHDSVQITPIEQPSDEQRRLYLAWLG